MKSTQIFSFAGALLVLLGVLLGAFGAHALKEVLNDAQLVSFETGVRYQIIHGLALLLIPMRNPAIQLHGERWILRLWMLGTMLFSGSIYALNLGRVLSWDVKWLGPITPLGGTLLIGAWAMICVATLKIALQRKQ